MLILNFFLEVTNNQMPTSTLFIHLVTYLLNQSKWEVKTALAGVYRRKIARNASDSSVYKDTVVYL